MIDGETKVHSLYGYPVAHSLSPFIFNKTFEAQGLNRTYIPFPVKPKELPNAVEAARTLSFEGFNVTMPHKTAIIPFLDRLEEPARKTGSVNTVGKTAGGLVGYNTDGEGALRAIKAYKCRLKDRNILVVGAGGASRAIVHSLSHEAKQVTILNRTAHKAREVTEVADGKATLSHGRLTKPNLAKYLRNADMIINATPVQTHALLRALGLAEHAVPPDVWLFDLAYNKRLPLLGTNVHRISPLEMLVQQAALSYEIWLKQPAPLELMRSMLFHHKVGNGK